MSEGVLTAVIAAGGTVCASLLQLRASLAKELVTRGATAPSRRKRRFPFYLIVAMLIGALVGGFALAQWLHEYERAAQVALINDLRERIAALTTTQNELLQARAAAQAQLATDVQWQMGMQGVAVLASVGPCRRAGSPSSAAPAQAPPPPWAAATKSSVPAPACSESDATPISLCATVPVAAKLTGVELFVRAADATTPWDASRATPGQAVGQARFAAEPSDLADGSTSRQVCEGFQNWSARPLVARMVVHYGP